MNDDHGPYLEVVNLADVQPEKISWLWPGRIALGKLTLLAGDPGLGKSLATCDISARVSIGDIWPDDSGNAPVGSTILLNAEDDLADTIRVRLDAAGADPSKVYSIQSVKCRDDAGDFERSVDLSRDLHLIETAISEMDDCRLIIIDPISAYLGKTDSHRNADIRRLLSPLAALAARHNVAVLAVTHLRKGEGAALYRAMGSLAFVAAARAVWAVCKDKENDGHRLMLPIKNNLAADQAGLRFSIIQRDESVAIEWSHELVEISADDALGIDRDTSGSNVGQAAEFLKDLLSSGPMPSKHVLADGRENGISEKTLRRAFEKLGGKPFKDGMKGGWYWEFPGKNALLSTYHEGVIE